MRGTSDPFTAEPPIDPKADADLEPVPTHPIPAWVATLDTGYFAVVMATGILAIGTRMLGFALLSTILVWCAAVAFVVLLIAHIVRVARFPRRFAHSVSRPASAVGYFTLVAGTDVLAICLSTRGAWLAALILGAFALLLWVVLNYGLLSSIVLAGNRPTLREIGGGWLIWVVATQSISILATSIASDLTGVAVPAALATIAVAMWSVGVMLYLLFVVIIFLRLLLVEMTPAELGPGYWILMGATAISVRAGAGLLELGIRLRIPLLDDLHSFATGVCVMLWSFGSWFIPLLLLIGIWRHVIHRYSSRYEPALWSVVFPLGMYAVASFALGDQLGAGLMRAIATGALWLALAAWIAVVVLMLVAIVRRDGPRGPSAGRSRPRPAAAP